MKFRERLIHFQNRSEKDFQHSKNLKSTANYGLAIVLFIGSTLFAGFSLPIRLAAKAFSKSNKPGNVRNIKTENLEDILKSKGMVLLDFWAEWCGPCLMMNPVIEDFAKGNPDICVAKVNADTNGDVVKKFNIRGLPQFVLLKDGAEVKRHAGAMTTSDLKKFCAG